MRSVITLAKSLTTLAALVLLASCAETPSTPTTSGGSSSGSGKVVTATSDETFDCDEDLILAPHRPKECIPPESAVQEPLEPLKPGPIVGTYRVFYTKEISTRATKSQYVLRVYPDNTATKNGEISRMPWVKENGLYRFLYPSRHTMSGETLFLARLESAKGEPDLATIPDVGWWGAQFEAIKLSDSPDHLFDLYQVLCDKGHYKDDSKCEVFGADEIKPGWKCHNIGRKLNDRKYYRFITAQGSTDVAETLEQCEAICEQALLNRFETVGEGNCSDYQG